MLAINDPIKASVHYGSCEWLLRNSFFSANLNCNGGTCKKCRKSGLTRFERVDVEFFGGDPEVFCLNCWSKSIFGGGGK